MERYIPVVTDRLILRSFNEAGGFIPVFPVRSETNPETEDHLDLQPYYSARAYIRRTDGIYELTLEIYERESEVAISAYSIAFEQFHDFDIAVEEAVLHVVYDVFPDLRPVIALEEESIPEEPEQQDQIAKKEKVPVPRGVILNSLSSLFATTFLSAGNYLSLYQASSYYRKDLRTKTDYNAVVLGDEDHFNNISLSRYSGYQINLWSGLSITTASLAMTTLADMYFPVNLSLTGKLFYSAGQLFEGVSLFLPHLGFVEMMRGEREYDIYLGITGPEASYFYDRYSSYFEKSQRWGDLSLLAGAVSAACKALAPVLYHTQTGSSMTGTKKVLLISGNALTALGTFSGALSFYMLESREETYLNYISATTNVDYYARRMDTQNTYYIISTVGAYTFWGLGTILKTAAVWIPGHSSVLDENKDQSDVDVAVVPLVNGIIIRLAF